MHPACGTSGTFVADINDVATATSYQWTYSGSLSGPATTTTSAATINYDVNGDGAFTVKAVNNTGGCTYVGPGVTRQVTRPDPFASTTIGGATTACIGSQKTVTLTGVPAGSQIVWTSSPSVTIVSKTTDGLTATVQGNTEDANAWVQASITVNSCGITKPFKRNINATRTPYHGSYSGTLTTGGKTGPLPYCSVLAPGGSGAGAYSGSVSGFDVTGANVTWSLVSKSPSTLYVLFSNVAGGGMNIEFKGQGSAVMRVYRSNSCGSYGNNYTFTSSSTLCPVERIATNLEPTLPDEPKETTLSPNPVDGKFTLSLNVASKNEFIKEVKIKSLDGKEVKKMSFKDDSQSRTVDLTGLKSGIYVVQYFDNREWRSKKIVKQ